MTLLRTWTSRLYLPLMLLGVNGLGIAGVASGRPPALLVVLLVVAIGLSFAAERLIPYRAEWNRSLGDGPRDVAHAVVNEGLSLGTTAAVPLLGALVPPTGLWPASLPFALQVVGAVVVLDAGIALAHVASHRWAWLWRLHAVHHSVRRLYGFNGLMKHPLHQLVETTAGATPLLVLGMPADVALALAFCTAVQLLLQHSNADYRTGGLEWLLALNRVHRFHHVGRAGDGDVNFGLYTNLVDHALGTFHYDRSRTFGSADLGIADEPAYPTGYVPQLVAPFQAR
jgi:sterol desaturase/sphingolipid hydroxylase (fatty acid hydroxylase superfamily)